MKQDVLRILLENEQNYVSGADISRETGVSRAAVWKSVQALKEDGYSIASLPGKGYIMQEKPDRVIEEEISYMLSSSNSKISKVYVYEEVVSTNNIAKELANKSAPEMTVVYAEKQSKGKGRMGRSWYSDPGYGMWFSIIIRPEIIPADAWRMTFLSAVAVCRAIRSHTGLEVKIKWPNDILFEEKKFCGILTELNAEVDQVNHIVIGIGINVNHTLKEFPEELADRVTSLQIISKRRYRRVELLHDVLHEFSKAYQEYRETGFENILKFWKDNNATLAETVEISAPEGKYTGKAVDVGEDGCLIVKTDDEKLHYIIVGDITVRKR